MKGDGEISAERHLLPLLLLYVLCMSVFGDFCTSEASLTSFFPSFLHDVTNYMCQMVSITQYTLQWTAVSLWFQNSLSCHLSLKQISILLWHIVFPTQSQHAFGRRQRKTMEKSSVHYRTNIDRQSHWCSLSLYGCQTVGGHPRAEKTMKTKHWSMQYITLQATNSVPWCGRLIGRQQRWCKHHLPLLLRGVEGPERTIPEMKTTRRRTRKLCECCCIPIIICAVRCDELLESQKWDTETRGCHSLRWLDKC